MKNIMTLADGTGVLPFIVEESAFEGVKRIAGKVAKDVEKVSGMLPNILTKADNTGEQLILCATLGKSALADALVSEGKLDISEVSGKREVFALKIVEKPFEGTSRALVIVGSDKLGTIYGMFALSEYIGVSPMCYWGDAEPLKKDRIEIAEDIEKVSK